MPTVRIGYQGDIGSNSEEAANLFAATLSNPLDISLAPLISSINISQAIVNKEITYGVMALRNNLGGEVAETKDALIRFPELECVWQGTIPIHHCLFCYPGQTTKELRYVASHIQALIQTRKTRTQLFPNMTELEIANTALGAKWLADGHLAKDTAIICRKETGEDAGVVLLAENIEDAESITSFGAFVLRKNGCR